jgi:hypothetical protein
MSGLEDSGFELAGGFPMGGAGKEMRGEEWGGECGGEACWLYKVNVASYNFLAFLLILDLELPLHPSHTILSTHCIEFKQRASIHEQHGLYVSSILRCQAHL